MEWKRSEIFSYLLLTMICLEAGCGDKDKSTCPWIEYPARNGDRVTIHQGIWGDVWFWEGDFMPMCPSGTVTPVAREVFIHEITSLDDVEMVDCSFYSEIHTDLVAETQSDESGFFEVGLSPGWYSIFVREDTLFYSNRFGEAENIYPVQVIEDEISEIRFDIDYMASW